MSAQSRHSQDTPDAIRGGPARGLCAQPAPNTPAPPRLAEPERRNFLLPPPSPPAQLSAWWYVFFTFTVGIAGLLALQLSREPTEDPIHVLDLQSLEDLDVTDVGLFQEVDLGADPPVKAGDLKELAQEVQRLRDRLVRVEERHQRGLRRLEVID